jgi:hypothetical protein
MKSNEQRIQELKSGMEFEVANNFPNGDRWNQLSDELDELERVPSTLDILMQIMNSPKEN